MYCEHQPENPGCRCHNCVLPQPDNVPWIDVLSLSMAEKDDVRKVSTLTRHSMESLASDAPEPKRLGDEKSRDQQQPTTSSVGNNPSTEHFLGNKYLSPARASPPPSPTPPPPPPQPTILLIVVNKPQSSSSALKGCPGCPGARPGCLGSGPEYPYPEARGLPGTIPEYSCPGVRGPPGPGPECLCPAARGYPGPGLGYPYPGPSMTGPAYPYPGPPMTGPEYPYPGPPMTGPEYPYPGSPMTGPEYPYPGVKRSLGSRPRIPSLETRGSSPGPRRFPGQTGPPKRYYNAPPAPRRRSGYDERFRYTSGQCSQKWYQDSPWGLPRRYSNTDCADLSRNCSSTSCRCDWAKSEDDRTESVEPIGSDNTIESIRTKESSLAVTKPKKRLGGSGYCKPTTNACPECHPDPQPSESNVCKGSCRSNISIKSKTQRNTQENCSKWDEHEEMQVVVTDNTKKTFRCLQVPICISVGKPENCKTCNCEALPNCGICANCANCGNCASCANCANLENFDCYSQSETISDDDDEDKCSCSSQGTDSSISQCTDTCNSHGTGSLNSKSTDTSNSQGTGSLNSQSTCSRVPQNKCSSVPQSKCSSVSQSKCSCDCERKCSCYSYGKCSRKTQCGSNMTIYPEKEEQKEANNFACNLSDLERTLRGLVPNQNFMCYLRKKNPHRRRRKKKCSKVCSDRFANSPFVFYPRPRNYDLCRKACCNHCCCAPVGSTTYNMDYCCSPGCGCC